MTMGLVSVRMSSEGYDTRSHELQSVLSIAGPY